MLWALALLKPGLRLLLYPIVRRHVLTALLSLVSLRRQGLRALLTFALLRRQGLRPLLYLIGQRQDLTALLALALLRRYLRPLLYLILRRHDLRALLSLVLRRQSLTALLRQGSRALLMLLTQCLRALPSLILSRQGLTALLALILLDWHRLGLWPLILLDPSPSTLRTGCSGGEASTLARARTDFLFNIASQVNDVVGSLRRTGRRRTGRSRTGNRVSSWACCRGHGRGGCWHSWRRQRRLRLDCLWRSWLFLVKPSVETLSARFFHLGGLVQELGEAQEDAAGCG